MEFLKKYIDRIILAAALLGLIGLVVWLTYKVGALRQEVNTEIRAPLRGTATKPLDFGLYDQTLGHLSNPPLWSITEPDLFGLKPSRRALPPPPPGPPVVLQSIIRRPFKLLFKAYSYNSQENKGYNFQLNFRESTFVIESVGMPVKNRWIDTGYQITRFERKLANVYDPAFGREVERDVSELTLEHAGEKPISLVVTRPAEEQEPVAVIRCGMSTQNWEIRRAQRFTCEGKVYNVVDISSKQMIILDEQDKKEYRFDLPGPAE